MFTAETNLGDEEFVTCKLSCFCRDRRKLWYLECK